MPIVIDASALAELVARTDRAPQVEALIGQGQLVAPDVVNAEVLSVLRRWLARSAFDESAAERAVRNLAAAPVRRFTTEPLIVTMWSLRHNVSPYDASYLCLAHRLGCSLLTLDQRLGRAPSVGVELVTVASGPLRQ